MNRFLVLFAREPAAQAREKGLTSLEAAALFREFGAGWVHAAGNAGAGLVLATPPEDLARWRKALPGGRGFAWIRQSGATLGARLEDAARRAAALGGHAVIVGGDVPPSESTLNRAFEALESGADAVLSPAPDGGVSLLALRRSDLDLLRGIRRRRRTVLRDLLRSLRIRRRRVELVGELPDLDGPRPLRAFLRLLPAGDSRRALVRSLLAARLRIVPVRIPVARPPRLATPSGLRAPPVPA